MTLGIFLAVLCAAVMHASWNAMVKSTPDKTAAMTAVTAGHAPLALLSLPFVPAPAPESWPWLAVSVLCHLCYQLFLVLSYRLGDYTQVYPIARGSGPAIVMLVSVFVLGVSFTGFQTLAIVLICFGIFLLALTKQINGLRNPRAVGAALITGCFIAAYSMLDGLGARASGSVVGYIAWMTIINAAVFSLLIAMTNRPAFITAYTKSWPVFIVGGSASVLAYVIVVWAMTKAPIAVVTALRETSTIFALLIGMVFLGEKISIGKVAATIIALSGVLLLRSG